MGYTTEFVGEFSVTPPLTAEWVEMLMGFPRGWTRIVGRPRQALRVRVSRQGGWLKSANEKLGFAR